jgi:hypothetical protein
MAVAPGPAGVDGVEREHDGEDQTMSVTDELLENNQHYAETFSGPLPLPPARGLAVIACMDARLNVYAILGLAEGEAHVIRNAGGVVTDADQGQPVRAAHRRRARFRLRRRHRQAERSQLEPTARHRPPAHGPAARRMRLSMIVVADPRY